MVGGLSLRDVRGGEGTLRLKYLVTGKWKATPNESLAETGALSAD
jgi:hypothetical protein